MFHRNVRTADPITRQEIKCCSGANNPYCIPINVPIDDQFFVGSHRQRCIDMIRSLAGVNTDCPLGNRFRQLLYIMNYN